MDIKAGIKEIIQTSTTTKQNEYELTLIATGTLKEIDNLAKYINDNICSL